MKIREIKSSEIEFLSDMLYEAIFIPEGHEKLPKEIIREDSLSRYITDWGKNEYDIAFVAEINSKLVGAIWGRQFESDKKGYGFVDDATPEISMALKTGYRNKGIGTRLINMLLQEYRDRGVHQVSLSVDKRNDALRLYKRIGFEIVSETDAHSLTMKKEIRK